MSISKTIRCEVCRMSEQAAGVGGADGWRGWGQLSGIALDGAANPELCPSCLASVAAYVDQMKKARSPR